MLPLLDGQKIRNWVPGIVLILVRVSADGCLGEEPDGSKQPGFYRYPGRLYAAAA
jgi:hypothetical protein